MWEETLVFTVHMPEIALIRFLVWDHDPIGRDFIGQRTIAFSSMMPGKRKSHPKSMGWDFFSWEKSKLMDLLQKFLVRTRKAGVWALSSLP